MPPTARQGPFIYNYRSEYRQAAGAFAEAIASSIGSNHSFSDRLLRKTAAGRYQPGKAAIRLYNLDSLGLFATRVKTCAY
jgi:hypothetical protein